MNFFDKMINNKWSSFMLVFWIIFIPIDIALKLYWWIPFDIIVILYYLIKIDDSNITPEK